MDNCQVNTITEQEEEKIGEFRKQLYARILARIGEAPEIGATNLSENDSA